MLKKISILLALGLGTSLSAEAAVNGFYIGGQFGLADIGYTPANLNIINATTPAGKMVTGPNKPTADDGNLGARLYMGYQFMPYLAAELGFDGFQSTDLDHMYGTPIPVNGIPYFGTHSELAKNVNDTAVLGGIDLVAKAMLPIGERFNIYAKGGVVYMEGSEFSGTFGLVENNQGLNNYSLSYGYDKDNVFAFRPVYGAGASYDITPKVVLDLSWTQIPAGSNIPQSNLYAIGLNYHFG